MDVAALMSTNIISVLPSTTLADAVRIMGQYQLGRSLQDPQVELIAAFLKTLTGALNGKPL